MHTRIRRKSKPHPCHAGENGATMATAISRLRRVFLRFKLFTSLEFAFTAHPFQGEKAASAGLRLFEGRSPLSAIKPLSGLLREMEREVLQTQ